MTRIDWNPTPKGLRRWAVTMLAGTAVAGCVLEFLLGQPLPARVVWGFGAAAFVTGITGTRAARPVYLAWMGLVWVVSGVLNFFALSVVFFLVVTPIGLAARLSGRDRLMLRRPEPGSLWREAPPSRTDRADRTF